MMIKLALTLIPTDYLNTWHVPFVVPGDKESETCEICGYVARPGSYIVLELKDGIKRCKKCQDKFCTAEDY